MQITFEPSDVTIRDVPSMSVAMIEHRGDRETIPDTRQRFMAWRRAAGQGPEIAPSYMVFRSEREPAIPGDYAMDLCVETDQPVGPNEQQVIAGTIPAAAAPCCAIPATPTISSPPGSTSIATGCRPAGRKPVTSPSIADASSR